MHLGSKMALDATPKEDPVTPATGVEGVDIKRLAPEVIESRLVDGTLLVVKVSSGGRQVMERLARADALSGVKMMAAVSEDVDLNDQTSLLWGIFTRFDPARDVFFPDMGMEGAAPVYRGPLAIDATFKPGYPAPLVMDPDIIERVDRRWDEYWT
jgi:4-hydroxy-3-polyprenylbenzoate decarboxylase